MSAWTGPDPSSAELEATERVRQASRSGNSPATMRELARDPDIIVRAAVAMNGRCDPEIDAILATDRDERVRALLGGRISRLLPELGKAEHDGAAEHVRSMLAELARDQATRVRAAIADEIKSLESAPRELVLMLAQDAAISVSDPIVRLSPVLTDSDLLTLLATPATSTSAESIASRTNLSVVVADAVVEHADAPAIRALLANQSACIQEATLDALIGRAPHHLDWHAPLVRRPCLSSKAIRALSEFIAADLLRVLAARTDLEPAKLDVVRKRLVSEITAGDEDHISEGRHLLASNGLTEEALLEAAHAGNTQRLASLLAVASGVTLRTIERAAELRSAKALVSLTWRSGYSMRLAIAVQSVLGQIGPEDILQATEANAFPLSESEMNWQLELMEDPPHVHTSEPQNRPTRSARHAN